MSGDKLTTYKSGKKFDTKSKIIAFAVLALTLVTIWFMLDLVLMTFILSFIFYHLMIVIQNALGRTKINRKYVPDSLILIVEYIIGLGVVALMAYAFVTILIGQTTDIANYFFSFDYAQFVDTLSPSLATIVGGLNVEQYLDQAGQMLLNVAGSVGSTSFDFVMSIALSFLILLEKDKIRAFGKVLETSRLEFLYGYFMIFGRNFSFTFGKVMKVQVTIAFVNSILSMILLAILTFPNIWGLGVLIFMFGLIPVAGVIISLIPLAIIAFNIGGIVKVIEVVIMIVLMHIIEAYVLNPKLMSSRTSLPVCFVFIILLVAQKYLGVWGLLIGVPLFIFLMAIFDVDYEDACRPKKFFTRERLSKFRRKNNATRRDGPGPDDGDDGGDDTGN
jgi:predicted PurR-regulated permease PerM